MASVFVLLGDVHGFAEAAFGLIARAKGFEPGAVPIVQVGDLGWNPDRPLPTPPWPIHFVEGNHDHLPSLLGHTEPTEVAPGWIYCPRGSVVSLEGWRVGFLGGARSIDRDVRVLGKSWWPEEEPTWREAERLHGQEVDLLVTHSPPRSVVRAMGFRYNVAERTSGIVEAVWQRLGRPTLICGHMHQRYRRGNVLALADLDVDVLERRPTTPNS